MLTIAPFAGRSSGSSARVATRAVFRFMANSRSQVATSPPATVSQQKPPATFTKPSRRPNCAWMRAAAVCMASSSVRSRRPSANDTPSASTSARSRPTAVQPAAARTTSIFRPSAPAAPVTATTPVMVHSLSMRWGGTTPVRRAADRGVRPRHGMAAPGPRCKSATAPSHRQRKLTVIAYRSFRAQAWLTSYGRHLTRGPLSSRRTLTPGPGRRKDRLRRPPRPARTARH